jgi:hypothetical protein
VEARKNLQRAQAGETSQSCETCKTGSSGQACGSGRLPIPLALGVPTTITSSAHAHSWSCHQRLVCAQPSFAHFWSANNRCSAWGDCWATAADAATGSRVWQLR